MSVEPTLDIPTKIAQALVKASKATGTDFKYLLNTAQRESSFNENARAKTSSASGLFQFIESTWLTMIKEEGTQYGLGDYAAKISKNSAGQYVVADEKDRREILELRYDPEVSALVAGIYAQKNANYVEEKIGRTPSSAEVYIAHFLGPADAARLIRLKDLQPHGDADQYFTSAAEANKGIFYDGGQARSISQVYQNLISKHTLDANDFTINNGQPKTTEDIWQVRANGQMTLGPMITNNKVNFWQAAKQPTHFIPADQKTAAPGSIGTWNNILGLNAATEGGRSDNFQADSSRGTASETFGQKKLLFDDNDD